ncbi:MAG: hypothetical protein JWN20_1430 [Jatrophihabitantaceae bacterium]|nr:hypothetical protein [Jatrophihabitantaceae bacterium]
MSDSVIGNHSAGPEPAGALDGLKVVALGGGHGLSVSLGALRRLTAHVTAVVTVADDGGSSGRIRSQLPVLPPGDLRMALAALAGDVDGAPEWADAFQHRLGGDGDLAGHPVGNLLLTGLMESMGDPVAALAIAARLLGCTGRVLPMSCQPLDLVARVADRFGDERTVRGQHNVAIAPGTLRAVSLLPPDARACPEALDAIAEADVVVLGPGSWYSSVLPHLLLPELLDALRETPARIVVTLNLVPQSGETDGFSPAKHVRVLRRYAPGLHIDTVLADGGAVADTVGLAEAAAQCGAELVLTSVAAHDDPARHDPLLLADAYRGVFSRPLAPTSVTEPALASEARTPGREPSWP